jgi:hypothetical protein
MAHKSRKKHIKHVQQHQAENDPSQTKAHPPGTKATSAALGAGTSHKVRLTSRAKAAAKAAASARGKVAERARVAKDEGKAKAKAKGGLVRRIAKAATKKITAKPQRALSRAKARVRSLLGRDKAAA